LRLWSIHPKYLDGKGLVALWRESLLAQKVLKGETKGYRHHPQLRRFMAHQDPERAITRYLNDIWNESEMREYNFNKEKIGEVFLTDKIPVTRGQLLFEFSWLCNKLKIRNAQKYKELLSVKEIECHPLFEIMEGDIEEWEKYRNE
jgi:hypothetical protein